MNKMCTFMLQNPIKFENICKPWEKFQNLINVGPWIKVGHEINVQSYVTKNPSNLKISVGHEKNPKIQ